MSGALSWTNKVADDADGAAAVGAAQGSFTTNSIDSAYPGSNAIDGSDPSRVTRVNYTTSSSAPYESRLEANWTTNADVRVVAALNVRLASDVVGVRFVVVNAAGTTLETTTQIPLASLVPIPGTTDRYNVYAVLSAVRSANRVRFQVQVPASDSDYYEVGALWAGPALVFTGTAGGWDREWRLGFVDDSVVDRGRGGAYASYRYPVRRRLQLANSLLSYADALGTADSPSTPNLRHLVQQAGLGRPVVAVTRDDDAHITQVASLYGLINALPEIGHLGGNRFGAGLVIEEVR